jgi:hypothetical protein
MAELRLNTVVVVDKFPHAVRTTQYLGSMQKIHITLGTGSTTYLRSERDVLVESCKQ